LDIAGQMGIKYFGVVSDSDFLQEKQRLQRERSYTLANKEALFYYRMLREHFEDDVIFPNMGASRSL
jgi:hypothetical protein